MMDGPALGWLLLHSPPTLWSCNQDTGIKQVGKQRGGDSALQRHRKTLWDYGEQRSLQEDERGVRQGFSSIPNMMSEVGKGKVRKRATQRRWYNMLSPVSRIWKEECEALWHCSVKEKENENTILKSLNVIPSLRADQGIFSYSFLAILIKKSHWASISRESLKQWYPNTKIRIPVFKLKWPYLLVP